MGLRALLLFTPAAIFGVSAVYFSALSALGPEPVENPASRQVGTVLAVVAAILCAISLLFALAVLALASLASFGGGEMD